MKTIIIIILFVSTIVANGQVRTEIDKQRFHQAIEMIKNGEPYHAQIKLNLLIESSPLDSDLYLARAKCNLMLKQYDLAMNDYEMASKIGNISISQNRRQRILYQNILEED